MAAKIAAPSGIVSAYQEGMRMSRRTRTRQKTSQPHKRAASAAASQPAEAGTTAHQTSPASSQRGNASAATRLRKAPNAPSSSRPAEPLRPRKIFLVQPSHISGREVYMRVWAT